MLVHNINISPDNFNIDYNFNKLNNKWLINLSNIDIPDISKFILQLGQKFNLPNNVINKENIKIEFVKHIENNLIKLDENTKNYIRKDAIPILNNINFSHTNDPNNVIIKKGMKDLIKFINNHPDILITRADKGNTTVVLNRNDYNSKMYEILNDNNTYINVTKDPTNKLTIEIRTILIRWKNKGYIDQSTYNKLYTSKKINLCALPTSAILIAGQPYKVMNAIFHYGSCIENDHFISMYREGSPWIEADDTQVTKKQWPRAAKNISTLFLENIDK
ncbi:hypothetical protein ALC57_07591 [Trachymyrmex cornetzi]|uniref:USP domain-containing protein n=1 Tax=Trachymyrmex cornetzi TaxID=471704 RepID=A0A151J7V9_9HYME|nr:hypothetical protein ALC57_07591 [Trachymyrmex cornetzi]